MSELVEFGTKQAADNAREEHDEYLCPVDDDKRTRTVAFVSDVPDDVLEQVRLRAEDSRGERASEGAGQIPLTDQERKDLDFTRDGVNVLKYRSLKGIARSEGVDDWTAFADPTLTVDEHREVYQQAATEGGGKRMDTEDSAAEKAGQAARRAQGEGCDHARDHCENGDPEACEFLTEACGYDEDEVEQLLSTDTRVDEQAADQDTTEQQDLVTVGGEGEFSEMDVTPEEAGALKRSWSGYKGGVADLSNALDELREATINSRQAIAAINAIRESHGEDPIHPDRLHDLLDALDDLPESIPETRTLAHFDSGGSADGSSSSSSGADVGKFAGSPDPADLSTVREASTSSSESESESESERERWNLTDPHAGVLNAEEWEEAKKALRFAERNSRDLDRDRLRSIRGHVGGSGDGPIRLSADDWDLLADAVADYEYRGVGTPAPEALHSLATKATERAEAAAEAEAEEWRTYEDPPDLSPEQQALRDALDGENPEAWSLVSEAKLHPTTAHLNLHLVDDRGTLSITFNSVSSDWTITHSNPHDHQRHADTAEQAVDLAKTALVRLDQGKEAFPPTESGTEPDVDKFAGSPAPSEVSMVRDFSASTTAPTWTVDDVLALTDVSEGTARVLADQFDSPGDVLNVAHNLENMGERWTYVPNVGEKRAKEIRRAIPTLTRYYNRHQRDWNGLPEGVDRSSSSRSGGPDVDKFAHLGETWPNRWVREPTTDRVFNADERGRIKHHAEAWKFRPMIRSAGISGPSIMSRIEETVGDTPEEFVAFADSGGDFQDVQGIGPTKAERMEAMVPLVREGIERRSADPEQVIETDDQQALGGGLSNPQARLAGGEEGERGQGEVVEQTERNPGGLLSDEREQTGEIENFGPEHSEQGGLEDVGVTEGLRDPDQGTLGGSGSGGESGN